jgi:hypothetical protein
MCVRWLTEKRENKKPFMEFNLITIFLYFREANKNVKIHLRHSANPISRVQIFFLYKNAKR